MAQLPSQAAYMTRLLTSLASPSYKCYGPAMVMRQLSNLSKPSDTNQDQSDISRLVPRSRAKMVLEKEFPSHYRDGKFVSRMSYVEFIDEALQKAKELGLEKDVELYKELLKIFPEGRFWPRVKNQFGLFNAPQQLAVQRLIQQMSRNGVQVDRDFEKLIIKAFSKRSDAWKLVARFNYWSMKFRNIDQYPLPEELPKEPHQLAKLAIIRMLPDHKSIVTVTNTSKVPNSVDKTWLVSAQSPTQQEIIDRLGDDATLYIEDGGLTYVGSQYLSYFILKYYVDEATMESKKPRPPDFNFNTLKVSFFGKPIKEKLESLDDKHYADGSYILAVGATGTSSQDSLLSWLKILQSRNPRLGQLNVVFKMSRPSPEVIKYNEGDGQQSSQNESSGDSNYQNGTYR